MKCIVKTLLSTLMVTLGLPGLRAEEALSLVLQLRAIPMGVVSDQWPQVEGRVHVPEVVKQLFPGQGIFVGLLAEDQASGTQLTTGTFHVEFEYMGNTQRIQGKKVKLVKQVFGEGTRSPASLGVLDCDFQIPEEGKAGVLSVRCMAVSTDGQEQTLGSLKIPVRDIEETMIQESPFPNSEVLFTWIKGYHRSPEPGKLFAAIRTLSYENKLSYPPLMVGFFMEALKASPVAAKTILKRLPTELSRTRVYGAHLLHWAGYDIKNLAPFLDDETRKSMENSPKMPDPYEPFDGQPDKLDFTLQCNDLRWGMFMASGKPKLIQVLVEMLQWKKEYRMFEKLQKKGKLPSSPTFELARGALYRNVGQSLRHFQATMPQLDDLLEAWQHSNGTPKEIREELKSLRTNPAFKPAEKEPQKK